MGMRITKPDTTTSTRYCYYNSSVQCSHGPDITAEIRTFSPAADPHVYPDITVAFIIGSAWMEKSPRPRILIDADHIIVMPGDPSSEDYDEEMPHFCCPIVIAVDQVINTHQMMQENHTETEVDVSVSDYVRGNIQHSILQCVPFRFHVTINHVLIRVNNRFFSDPNSPR